MFSDFEFPISFGFRYSDFEFFPLYYAQLPPNIVPRRTSRAGGTGSDSLVLSSEDEASGAGDNSLFASRIGRECSASKGDAVVVAGVATGVRRLASSVVRQAVSDGGGDKRRSRTIGGLDRPIGHDAAQGRAWPADRSSGVGSSEAD